MTQAVCYFSPFRSGHWLICAIAALCFTYTARAVAPSQITETQSSLRTSGFQYLAAQTSVLSLRDDDFLAVTNLLRAESTLPLDSFALDVLKTRREYPDLSNEFDAKLTFSIENPDTILTVRGDRLYSMWSPEDTNHVDVLIIEAVLKFDLPSRAKSSLLALLRPSIISTRTWHPDAASWLLLLIEESSTDPTIPVFVADRLIWVALQAKCNSEPDFIGRIQTQYNRRINSPESRENPIVAMSVTRAFAESCRAVGDQRALDALEALRRSERTRLQALGLSPWDDESSNEDLKPLHNALTPLQQRLLTLKKDSIEFADASVLFDDLTQQVSDLQQRLNTKRLWLILSAEY